MNAVASGTVVAGAETVFDVGLNAVEYWYESCC